MSKNYKIGDMVVALENKNVSGFKFSKGEVYTIVEMTSYDFGLKGGSEYPRYCTKDTLDEYFTKEPNDPVNETKVESTLVLEEQKEEMYTVEMKNGRLIVANLTEDEYEEVKKTLEDCAFVQINHYLIPCEDIAMIIEGEELC